MKSSVVNTIKQNDVETALDGQVIILREGKAYNLMGVAL